MSPEPGGEVAVSVIVPVHNPGVFLEVCIDSLLGQSLPRERYELIFVDDGSTDQSPKRLDELATSEPNVQVFHEPASGWSGRPRNIGIDHAVGRYVFFCDHDDWLEPEALERMVDYADETAADVLIPKMIGHKRGVPHALFRTNEPDATLWTKPLMSSLTPHKLFRRSFLDGHALRFPEGKRRLEDHVFVVQAYFLASKIAVLSDYPCYHHVRREDNSNAAYQRVDPALYFSYVREVLDIIEAHTEPGPDRDHVLERPFGHEMLGRLVRKRAFGSAPPEYRQILFGEVRKLMLERFPPDFGERLALANRVRAAAVRNNRIDLIVDINQRAKRVIARAVFTSLRWDGDRWQAEIEAEAAFADGSPLRFTPLGDDRWSVDPRLLPADVHDDYVLSTRDLLRSRPSVTVVERVSDEEWYVPAKFTASLRDAGDSAQRVVVTGTAELDPATLAGGRPLPDGTWDISVSVSTVGFGARARLGVDASVTPELPTAVIVGQRPATAIPYLTDPTAKLSIDVGQRKHTLVAAMLARPTGPVELVGDELTAAVEIDVASSAAPRRLRVLLVGDGEVVGECEAAIVAAPAGAVLRAGITPSSTIDGVTAVYGPARYSAAIRPRAKDAPMVLGTIDVDGRGRICAADFSPAAREHAVPLPRAYGSPSLIRRVKRRARRSVRRVGRGNRT